MITVDRTLTAGAWVGDPVHSDISFALASAALSAGEGGGRVTALAGPVDIPLGFGAGNVVVADPIGIAIGIEFTTIESDPR